MQNRTGMKWRKAGIVLFWVGLWEVVSLCVGNRFLLVSPIEAIQVLFGLIGTGVFWKSIGISFLRIVTGFFLGVLAGGIFACVSFWNRLFRDLIAPVVTLMKAVPVVSFVVLFLIWFGPDSLSVIICFMIVFPNLYLNMLEGLVAIPKEQMEMAQLYHFPAKTKFFYLYRPGIRTYCSSALKISLGLCWKSGVAAEVIGLASNTIGERLYLAKISLDTGEILAWTVVIILISIGFEKLVLYLADCFWNMDVPCAVVPKTEHPCEIQVDGLSKAYGENRIFTEYQLSLKPGEEITLDWPSGAGKTTLFRLLSGLEEADSGEIKISKRVAYLFQENRLVETESALKNLEMVTGEPSYARVLLSEILNEEDITRPVSNLSGGMKRRVSLARAMAVSADVVLLDEPYTGLDTENRKKAKSFIERHKRGRAVIIASHVDM